MEINGLEIHVGYIVTSAIWIAGVIGMWAAVVTIISRFAARGGTKAYRRAMKVRLTYVTVITVMLTVIAFDSAEIFFDGYGYVILGANRECCCAWNQTSCSAVEYRDPLGACFFFFNFLKACGKF